MTQLALLLAPKHIQEARDAYRNAPHGYKLKALYRLQSAVTEQLRREATVNLDFRKPRIRTCRG